MSETHRHDLVGQVAAIEYAENRGVAFGLLQGQTLLVALLGLIVVALAINAYRQLRSVSLLIAIGSGLILGGAIGNGVDRLRLGFVIDFIAIWSWPNFNVADSAITFGVGIVIWQLVRDGDTHGQDTGIQTYGV